MLTMDAPSLQCFPLALRLLAGTKLSIFSLFECVGNLHILSNEK